MRSRAGGPAAAVGDGEPGDPGTRAAAYHAGSPPGDENVQTPTSPPLRPCRDQGARARPVPPVRPRRAARIPRAAASARDRPGHRPGHRLVGSAGLEMPVRPGDHVVFPASAGAWVEVDEERLLVCGVSELLGVLEQSRDCPDCAGSEFAAGETCPVCGRQRRSGLGSRRGAAAGRGGAGRGGARPRRRSSPRSPGARRRPR